MQDATYSLTWLVCECLDRAGIAADVDDVHTLLGLSFLVCAVPREQEPAAWSAYARDAFLESAAPALGIEIRHIHPPEASTGIESSAEFRQHFDASYQPLMENALNNNQQVWVWGGWDAGFRNHWGEVTEINSKAAEAAVSGTADSAYPNMGISGIVYTGRTNTVRKQMNLVLPPRQVYVVERAGDSQKSLSQEGLVAAISHSVDAYSRDTCARFSISTGASAIGAWHDLVAAKMRGGIASPMFATSNFLVASSVTAGLVSAARYFSHMDESIGESSHRSIQPLLAACQVGVSMLADLSSESRIRQLFSCREGMAKACKSITEFQQLQIDLHAMLEDAHRSLQ